MVNIKVRNSYIDGEKAYTIGDWNGSKPCHWNTSKMILRPFEKEINSSKYKNKYKEFQEEKMFLF